jgi:hypothetical protein
MQPAVSVNGQHVMHIPPSLAGQRLRRSLPFMSPDDPAQQHFRIDELPFEGFWQILRMWLTSSVDATFRLWSPVRPSRVCIVRIEDGTILSEGRCYADDRSTVRNLQYMMDTSTVREFVEAYELPVTMG